MDHDRKRRRRHRKNTPENIPLEKVATGHLIQAFTNFIRHPSLTTLRHARRYIDKVITSTSSVFPTTKTLFTRTTTRKGEFKHHRNNLVIHGIPFSPEEASYVTVPEKATEFFTHALGIDVKPIDAFYLGRPTLDNPKPLMVKLRNYAEKLAIFQNLHKLKTYGLRIVVRNDMSKEERRHKSENISHLRTAKQQSQNHDMLIINQRSGDMGTDSSQETKEAENLTVETPHQSTQSCAQISEPLLSTPHENRGTIIPSLQPPMPKPRTKKKIVLPHLIEADTHPVKAQIGILKKIFDFKSRFK